MNAGTWVRVTGASTYFGEFNGRCGVASTFDAAKERYRVRLEARVEEKMAIHWDQRSLKL
mgnify:CR=1 FL=1